MKYTTLFIVATCAALVSLAGDPASGLTTNLVVYTNVHSPDNTSHYYATRLNLEIRNGLIVGCCDEGVFDLFNGLTAAESKKVVAERTARSHSDSLFGKRRKDAANKLAKINKLIADAQSVGDTNQVEKLMQHKVRLEHDIRGIERMESRRRDIENAAAELNSILEDRKK